MISLFLLNVISYIIFTIKMLSNKKNIEMDTNIRIKFDWSTNIFNK